MGAAEGNVGFYDGYDGGRRGRRFCRATAVCEDVACIVELFFVSQTRRDERGASLFAFRLSKTAVLAGFRRV